MTALELKIRMKLSRDLGAYAPIEIEIEESNVMRGKNITFKIPGQTRAVFIGSRKLEAMKVDPAVEDAVLDDLRIAAWILLDIPVEE